MFNQLLSAFGIDPASASTSTYGSGLINHTWLVKTDKAAYILQRMNQQVFPHPAAIADNMRALQTYLAAHSPRYRFVGASCTADGENLVHLPGKGYFRLFSFVEGSHTIDVVQTPEEAFEAAQQFGRFTKLLKNFPVDRLQITLPGFHHLGLRYQQFETAIKNGHEKRLQQSHDCINFLRAQHTIVTTYERLQKDPAFKLRVTHHDTKISNVLFNQDNKGICVIDLDTVMPGYFISDVGDMLRTYLSPVSEEESDYSKIEIRDDYFKAIADGYLSEMKDELTLAERQHFVYAGKFLIYMQALRFLTDYLNNDVYYGTAYEGQNFVRTGNQIELLKQLIAKETQLTSLV